MNAITDVSAYFDTALEIPGTLPLYTGDVNDAVLVWRALHGKKLWVQWREAAIAASIARECGQRTDRGRGPTRIQQFCADAPIGASHFSRLVRTHTVFDGLLATGSKPSLVELLQDQTLRFKHFLVAANYAVLPVEALLEARMHRLSANELGKWIAGRKSRQLIDANGEKVVAADEDDDSDFEWRLPTRDTPRRPPAIRLDMTTREHRQFVSQLRALSAAYGTVHDTDTLLLAVARAFELESKASEVTA